MYDALYARQSIEKKDSISVESQLEYCRYKTHGEACIEYTDRGFLGKDTNRSGFEKMMNDIRAGKIKRVIVYKLDRISRSILDFANMMEIFQKYHEEVPEESEQLKLIYSMYADTDNSLGDVVRYLNEHQIKNLRGANWNTARISEMLRNPVYVEADINVYQFFQSQGANIYNPASGFTGYNACYLYKGTVSTSRKQSDLSDKEIVLAPHKGFIPSKTWLACRIRCLNNRQSTKTCKPKNSWLVGKVKCGNCGYALTIRKAKTKWERYFVCSQSGSRGSNCTGAGCTIYADVLEEYMLGAIKERLSEFQKLSCLSDTGEEQTNMTKKIRLTQIEEEIEELLSKVSGVSGVLMKYIDEKVTELDAERKACRKKSLRQMSQTQRAD